MKTNNLYRILFLLCFLFAAYNLFTLVIHPKSSSTIKCEGLILDKSRSYHITDKNSLNGLAAIRPELNVNSNDILLHYRDKDMELVTPSYWGSFIFNGNEWTFKLDKSFSSNPNTKGNFQLPFLRWTEPKNGAIRYVKPNELLTEKQLQDELYFNTPFGTKASRFYIQILNRNGLKVLPFFDEGMKKFYPLNHRENDTINVKFGSSVADVDNHRLFNFAFTNTSGCKVGNYEVIHNSSNSKIRIKNLITGAEKVVSRGYFQIEDMLFSIKNNQDLFSKSLFVLYLLIILLSFIALNRINTSTSVLGNSLFQFRVILLCFLLLGFPTLVFAFENQSFSLVRKLLVAVLTPAIPVGSYYLNGVFRFFSSKVKMIGASSLFYKIRQSSLSGVMLLAVIGVALLPLFFSNEERVLGVPTMHFVKLLVLGIISIAFSPVFNSFFVRVSKILPYPLRRFTLSIFIVLLALLVAGITSDFSSLLFISITVFLLDLFYGRYPIAFSKFKFRAWFIPVIYFLFSIVALLLGNQLGSQWRKSYRFTYSYASPASDLYNNVNAGDRESFGILYQNLQVLKENPFGLGQLSIPHESVSVSHTDFALSWDFLSGGLPFIILLFISIIGFVYSILYLVRILTLKHKNGLIVIQAQDSTLYFLGFILLMFSIQAVIPFASNLFLPGALLAGVSFPFVSISIYDSILIIILLLLLDRVDYKSSGETNLHIYEEFDAYSRGFAKKWTIGFTWVMLAWVLIRLFLLLSQPLQEDFRWDKNQTNLEAEKISVPKMTKGIISVLDSNFRNEDLELLTASQKQIGLIMLHEYYGHSEPLSSQNSYYTLPLSYHKRRLSIDSVFVHKKIMISGLKWNEKFPPTYVNRVFNNQEEQYINTSKYFKNLDYFSKSLDIDQSGFVNKNVEEFCNTNLKGYKPTISVLVTDKDGRIIVNAGFPFDKRNPEVGSYFPGSVKKTLLACFVAQEQKKLIDAPVMLSSGREGSVMSDWIRLSDNTATLEIFKKIDAEKFALFVEKQFNMQFYSMTKNGYTELPFKDFMLKNDDYKKRTLIGGAVRYTAQNINSWGRVLFNQSQKNDQLFTMLNSPFNAGGTAYAIAQKLTSMGFKPEKFIVKTGTLEENGQNIASSFLIANKDYSISVLIDGKQPSNSDNASAKSLFIQLIPLLESYLY